MKQPRNQESIKKLNRVNALKIIRENEDVSRQQLAELMGLTPAAISGIVRELVELGYIEEIGLGESSGGRRPVRLRFCPEAGYVIGAEVTRNRTTFGISDLLLRPVKVSESFIDMHNPQLGIDALVNSLNQLVAEAKIPKEKILAAGFAFPGLLDQRTKVIKRSPSLGDQWFNIPVKELLEARIHTPLHIEHNPNAAALAEFTLGKGKDIKHMAYVNLGEGFSTGVIVDGKMLYGSRGHAGEMGHVVVVEDGPLCNCGNRGCLESLYAVPALVARANNELPLYHDDDALKNVWLQNGKVTFEDIIATSVERESYAWKLIRQAGWYIGIGIANIINFYNPELVCLGGIMAECKSVLTDPLIESVYRHAFPEIAKETRLEISSIGRTAGFYGACLGAIQPLFTLEGLDV